MESSVTASDAWAQCFIKHLNALRPDIDLCRAIPLCIEAFEKFSERSPALVAEWVALIGSVPPK